MLTLLGLLGLVGTAAATTTPTVTVSSGPVVGTISPPNVPSGDPYANVWLGIPYAKPPVADLRWRPPQEPEAWKEPLLAQKLPNACHQQFSGAKPGRDFLEALINNPPLEENEDCLYLNVYAPADASSENKKAVMFYIHGGNLQTGSASAANYNGTSLAVNHDVILVTINYRTNIFGFIEAPSLDKADRNPGFVDQRLALNWTYDNIEQFGGDRNKITIFGESAGGYSVKQLLANPPGPPGQPPFRAAIMQSQQAMFLGKALRNDYTVVRRRLGCDTLECMRGKSAAEIMELANNGTYLGTPLFFAPTSGSGNSLNNVRPTLREGSFADVPIMYGTNKNEGSIFAHVRRLNTAKEADKRALPPQQVLVDDVQSSDAETNMLPLCQNLSDRRCFLKWSKWMTGVPFTCPTSELAKFTAKHNRMVWRYRYSPEFPNLTPYDDAGAYHGAELPQVFGTYNATTATKNQIALSAFMQKTWTDFAKDPENGPGWPSLNEGSKIADFGNDENPQGITLIEAKDADENCGVWFRESEAYDLAW
ncbi:Carboxylesterase [Aspergillus parasiticus]|uniref:Carboxylic ester hydrolase n=1 Tax=Aspergillus parasiticus TaxID=5067 RepID=A0A5N6E2Y8_ASPPA|nr:Carboxylesterase [Aspergillus parasiticus]